ncbi:MAG: Na+/H+ antiporter subunit E [Hyphomicrobiales bacterium]
MRALSTALLLLVVWLLLSGLYKPLIIGLGLASIVITVWVLSRMHQVDGDHIKFPIRPFKMASYAIWLLVEIAKSNWRVANIILDKNLPDQQHLFRIPNTQKSDLGQVVFANSITLTPATISVEIEDGTFLVHALKYESTDLDALADMDQRVTATETGRA